MQPLDVGIFQPYKYWHDMAIQDALLEFNLEYKLTQFFEDYTKIRDNTFKKSTIQHAFKKSRMWSINPDTCIQQLKTFAPLPSQDSSGLSENIDSTSFPAPLSLKVQPMSLTQVESGLSEWQEKIQQEIDWSDLVTQLEEFETFIDHSKKFFTKTAFNEVQLSMFQKRTEKDLQAKTI